MVINNFSSNVTTKIRVNHTINFTNMIDAINTFIIKHNYTSISKYMINNVHTSTVVSH